MSTQFRETFHLPEGPAKIEYPVPLSGDSFKDFCDWLSLIQYKISRLSTAPKTAPEPGKNK